MSSILSNAPYYDKYDSSKQYTQLLAVPGRVAQAREITEIQSTLKDIIKSLGDSFLNDGNVIEGCQVIPDKVKKKVTVTAGKIYMRGLVMNLKESTIDINAEGTEIIGVKLKETFIYESDDPDLRDPALGYENYNQPGMDRLKSELVVVKMDNTETSEAVAMIATLIDGELSVEQQAPNYSALNETLARRTYDESGSYIVNGLSVRVESHPTNTSLFNVVVESGKAYVHGYELTIPSARRISMPRATTATNITANYGYSSSDPYYFLTTGPYVKSITKVIAPLQSSESVTISNSQGAPLSKSNAYQIVSVSNSSGETFDSNKYRLEQGPTPYIRWNDTTYPGDVTVVYYYKYECEQGKDYELYLDENNNHYLRWKSTSTLSPVNTQTLEINYEKYLARKDTVYMDQYGNINVLQGIPADYGLEVATDAPAYTLPLSIIMSPPGGSINISDDDVNINVSNIGLTRFTMSDINDILTRVKTMAYDQTVLSLNTEAKDYSADKRGIFTDPFIDFSKLDLYFNLLNGERLSTDRPIFDVALDLDSNMIYLPLISKYYDATFNEANSTVTKNTRVASLKLDGGERVVLSQMNATKSFLLAPYLSYPQTPEIFLDPSLDSWYDDTTITVPASINTTKIVSSSSRNIHTRSGSGNSFSLSTSIKTSTSAIGKTVEDVISEDLISEEAVTYIRERLVNVSGSNYPAMLDNIKCYFEGIELPLTPTGTSVRGTADGSVKSDANGKFTATFEIPGNKILTGNRVVTLESSSIIEGYSSSASAFYQAIGIARTFKKTVTTITTVLLERVTTTKTHTTYFNSDPDPLAQTFVLDEMTILNAIDIYFESVPTANVPVTCEIREVVNGSITSKIYGFKTLTADSIRDKVSSKADKATRFVFNDPVLIEANTEYAFVLKSSSTDYRAFIAEIGENDVDTGELVLTNPYLVGVMMSSSNNSSWTAHQKSDVKFRLISYTYENSSELLFNNINSTDGFCRMNLSAESLVFEGTSINWFYSIDEGATYQSITPDNMKYIESLNNNVMIKARLNKSEGVTLSPLVALDSVGLTLECYDNTTTSPYYISNMISGLDDYDTVEIILDTYEPTGTSLNVYVSPSNNNADPYIMKEATVQPLQNRELKYGWTEKTYKVTLDSEATQCRIFVKFNSNTKFRTPAIRKLRSIMS